MKRTLTPVFLLLLSFTFFATDLQAQTVPSQQGAGGVSAREDLLEKEATLRDVVTTPKEAPSVEVPVDQEAQIPEGEKVLVSRIEVTGATLLSAREIRKIIAEYEGKELSMRGMQEVANKITDAYRQRGYITSRAILPPQRIENNVLKIEVLQGTMGSVDVQGNRYYRTSLIKKRIQLKKGDVFDYNKLKTNLGVLNQYPDRKVKTVLTPGQEQGTTDLVLNVEDKLPIHVGLSYDNYASKYLGRSRYQGTLTHNNLLGFDDIFTLTYQLGEGHNTYRLSSARYLYPLSSETQIGFSISKSQLELGREFANIEARGKSKIYSVYLTHDLISDGVLDLTLNAGFDYKDVFNFQLGDETSRDRLRVARLGLKWDRADAQGRTIINNEIHQGIPNKGGALGDRDDNGLAAPNPSRSGAGGEFTKNVVDVLRLQRVGAERTLLLKGQGQLSSRALTATEQYQLGGIFNLRGYPSGEAVGDHGFSTTAELSSPVPFLAGSIKAPGSKVATLREALRWVVFYDWGQVSLRRPTSAEYKHRTLTDWGVGLRYDLPENFSVRVDVAWPIDETPSDENHMHGWVKVSKDF
ncbi:MAG: ShlB/FhaC/HecB family hemolysin secretion/activation protein [Elusimicrobia bacterium]|nr:ShlB/FhaC/HecB family hemolysin secretion/activation protein [Elusimicrobiota bacterium]